MNYLRSSAASAFISLISTVRGLSAEVKAADKE
jgi:hypothetical protein